MFRDRNRRYGPSPMSPRRGVVTENRQYDRSSYEGHRKPQFHSNYGRDQPREYANFVIHLRSDHQGLRKEDVDDLIEQLKWKTDNFTVLGKSFHDFSLFFQQWIDTLEAMVFFWKVRVEGTSMLIPKLVCNVIVPSDTEELNSRLQFLFIEHINSIVESDLVKKWEKKLAVVLTEISKISAYLSRPKRLVVYGELTERKRGLILERDLILKRIKEFKNGMKCILSYLEGKMRDSHGDNGFDVFYLRGSFDWWKIYKLIVRECRRLDDGLPIYAFRQEILKRIHSQQVLVMVGETGSGKSTQLVQFIADTGIAGDGSIICTQPRKLAAVSLAQRVVEECNGCYPDTSISFCPTFSSVHHNGSQVIYTTDNCMLQHYLNDENLSRVSCIIVDEAHERSLNTDILLGLLKKLLDRRPDLRLIIMSATIDAKQLAEYFFGCGIFHVVGRNFPVEIRYVPCATEGTSCTGTVASYVFEVLRLVEEIHRTETEGTILAFLTSQFEVELACEKLQSPSAVVLALHGKLTIEDQARVFDNYPGKRKIIFTTNIAETSLTIPGVKYVVDSGMVKECRFEAGTGMNVLKVCRISQSSANQRAGRAGRTEPGRCYRLYSEDDYSLMSHHQEPEICRVHIGIAVLRILSLGISNVLSFDFIDAPSAKAIDMAVQNLVQLGAVTRNDEVYELTKDGWKLVRLGIEPRIGKIILSCLQGRLGREGLVLAAVMTNSSSIFCRIGTEENKLKSDRLKVQFCHSDGDLFTLLSVYKEWESVPHEKRNSWCWNNSINAKSMKRCREMVKDLESCLQVELNIIVPAYWAWTPLEKSEHDITLKKAILSSLPENVAMYSGYDQLGFEVAVTGKNARLHPSCSLLAFSERPSWVVFGDMLSVNNHYLVCVTAVEIETLNSLRRPLFDVSEMGSRKLQVRVLKGFGTTVLKRFCGKSNNSLLNLVSRIKYACNNERIGVEVDKDLNEILLFASSQDIEKVYSLVSDALEYERKYLQNECAEKCLYIGGSGVSPSVALFGSGAEIKHLELNKRHLTVDVFHSDVNAIDDKELVTFLERITSSSICTLHKYTSSGQDTEEKEKWGRVTFLTPEAAERAVELNGADFRGDLLKVVPVWSTYGGDHKLFSFPGIKAKVCWPRRISTGRGIVKCDRQDVARIIEDLSNLIIGDNMIRCGPSQMHMDSVVISRLNTELSEAEIQEALSTATDRRILSFFLLRGEAFEDRPCATCEEALLREITPFMPKRNSHINSVHIQVFSPEPKDINTRALITFNGSMHLEAARALEHIEGKVLPGCLPWQKIKCQQLFHSFVSCPSPVYPVIKEPLNHLISNLRQNKGVECNLDINENGSYRVKLSANATKVVAELRRPLEQLMRGTTVEHPDLIPAVLQLLFSKEGVSLMRSIQHETGTYILFDRQCMNVRVFGASEKIALAQQKLTQSLLTLHESKQLEVHLRGSGLPPDLMKKVVRRFGPDLQRLKEEVAGAEFTLNTRHHTISVHGSKQDKYLVEEIVRQIAQTSTQLKGENEASCPICLCEVDDGFRMEGCGHEFCRSCLLEQCESAIKSRDCFPMRCAYKDCGAHFLIADLKSLLSNEKLDELFRASLGAFVAASGGVLRFCPSPDCPSVYRVADPDCDGLPYFCGACSVETCTKCHLEYHPYLSCERYKEFKEDRDSSLKQWCKGKEHVKFCPLCGFTIEKVDGCNHVECRCGRHICWVCLESYGSSDDCYNHLRSIHQAII